MRERAAVTLLAAALFLGSLWLGGPRARDAVRPVPLDTATHDGTTISGAALSDVSRAVAAALRVVGVESRSAEDPRRSFTSSEASRMSLSTAERVPTLSGADPGGSGGGLDPAKDSGDEGSGNPSGSGGGSGGTGGARP